MSGQKWMGKIFWCRTSNIKIAGRKCFQTVQFVKGRVYWVLKKIARHDLNMINNIPKHFPENIHVIGNTLKNGIFQRVYTTKFGRTDLSQSQHFCFWPSSKYLHFIVHTGLENYDRFGGCNIDRESTLLIFTLLYFVHCQCFSLFSFTLHVHLWYMEVRKTLMGVNLVNVFLT